MLEAIEFSGRIDRDEPAAISNADQLVRSFLTGRLSYTRDSKQIPQRFPLEESTLSRFLRERPSRDALERLARVGFLRHREFMALLLSVTPISAMSPEAVEALGVTIIPQSKVTIKGFHENWGLCDTSEESLFEDIGHGSALLLGESLLVKSRGRWVAGLCVETASTSEGTFLKGAWYEPTDESTLIFAKTSIQERLKSAPLIDGQWAYMRDVTAYHPAQAAQILQQAREYAFGSIGN